MIECAARLYDGLKALSEPTVVLAEVNFLLAGTRRWGSLWAQVAFRRK